MSDLFQDQAECSHVWQDGWCSSCGLGWATWSSAEIDRLRAEVERLTHDKIALNILVDRTTQERDEALAQVTILAQEAQKVVDNHEEGFSCQDGVAQNLPKLLKNLPVEARALLDRLHALEVSVNLLYENAYKRNQAADGMTKCEP